MSTTSEIYLCWKWTIMCCACRIYTCQLHGLPGPIFTQVSHTSKYVSLFDAFCLLRFYTRWLQVKGNPTRAKKWRKKDRKETAGSCEVLTANLNNHLKVLTNGNKRDMWHLKMPKHEMFVYIYLFSGLDLLPEMNKQMNVDLCLPSPWNKNIVKSLN